MRRKTVMDAPSRDPGWIALPIAEDEQASADGDLGGEESRLTSYDPPAGNSDLVAGSEAKPQPVHDTTWGQRNRDFVADVRAQHQHHVSPAARSRQQPDPRYRSADALDVARLKHRGGGRRPA